MNLNGVEGIPSGLLTCFINKIEVHIMELAPEGFTFRVPDKIDEIQSIELNFFIFDKSEYKTVQIEIFELQEEQTEVFYETYTIVTTQSEYKESTQKLIKNYTDYIYLKLSGDDAYLSEQMVNYPAELEEDYALSFKEQKKGWFSKINSEQTFCNILDEYVFALNIDNYKLYEQYLNLKIQEFQTYMLKENYFENYPIVQKKATRLYIGNQFCHNLFPKKAMLWKLLDKAYSEEMEITLAFTYLREEFIAGTSELLDEIYRWCERRQKRIELVVNDWGMMSLLQDKLKWMELSFGILLNKQRKDPRYRYKKGYLDIVDKLAENNLGYVDYSSFLENKFHIGRFEYEAAGHALNFPKQHNSLHIPYFQTNTSQFCTLYAQCKNGARGKQELPRTCPRYCEENVFLYPKHLKMIGRYNSLFGLDDTVLKDASILNDYLKQGIDRIVLSLW